MNLKAKAREIKRELKALNFALMDPRTPRLARWLGVAVMAYALSPLDLIPDFVPVLGYLDDIILLPLGIVAVLKMLPDEVLAEARAKAADDESGKGPPNWLVGGLIVCLWVACLAAVGWWLYRRYGMHA